MLKSFLWTVLLILAWTTHSAVSAAPFSSFRQSSAPPTAAITCTNYIRPPRSPPRYEVDTLNKLLNATASGRGRYLREKYRGCDQEREGGGATEPESLERPSDLEELEPSVTRLFSRSWRATRREAAAPDMSVGPRCLTDRPGRHMN